MSPEAADGGPIAAVKNGDTISYDIPARRIDVDITGKELQRRLEKWESPKKKLAGYLARYSALVRSADDGAILAVEKLEKGVQL